MIAAASAFLLALCLTLYPLAAMRYNTEHQSMIHTQYEQVMEQVDDSELRRERQLSEAYNAMLVPGTQEEAFSEAALLSARNEYATRLNFSGNGIMGYVRIPKIQAVLPIYHGTSETTLEIGVGHLLGSSLPIGGVSTHTVLTGHSGMASQKMFSDLPDLELGSLFYLDVLGETLAYHVDQIETVLPHDSSLLEIVNGEDHCTLVTCTPFGVNTHRLLVRGTRVPLPEENSKVVELPDEVPGSSTWEFQYLKGILWGIVGAVSIALVFLLGNRFFRHRSGGKYAARGRRKHPSSRRYRGNYAR